MRRDCDDESQPAEDDLQLRELADDRQFLDVSERAWALMNRRLQGIPEPLPPDFWASFFQSLKENQELRYALADVLRTEVCDVFFQSLKESQECDLSNVR